MHGLQVERDMEHDGEEGRHAEEVDHVAGDERTVDYDALRCEGFARPFHFHEGEQRAEDGEREEGVLSDPVIPSNVSATIEGEEEGEDGDDKCDGAGEIQSSNLGVEVTYLACWEM